MDGAVFVAVTADVFHQSPLAQMRCGCTQPVQRGDSGERIVDAGGQGSQTDFHQLVDQELRILFRRAGKAEGKGGAQAIAATIGAVTAGNLHQGKAFMHEIAGAHGQRYLAFVLASQFNELGKVDQLNITRLVGQQRFSPPPLVRPIIVARFGIGFLYRIYQAASDPLDHARYADAGRNVVEKIDQHRNRDHHQREGHQ